MVCSGHGHSHVSTFNIPISCCVFLVCFPVCHGVHTQPCELEVFIQSFNVQTSPRGQCQHPSDFISAKEWELLQERTAILQLHAGSLPLADDVVLPDLATACHGYSGADLAALCREAAMGALSDAAAAILEGKLSVHLASLAFQTILRTVSTQALPTCQKGLPCHQKEVHDGCF